MIDQMVEKIEQWHHDRNLVEGSDDKTQMLKFVEELGELAGNMIKGKCIKDDIGDMLVVLINIAMRNNVSIYECLEVAYNEIKDRKGKMVNGSFIKDIPEKTPFEIEEKEKIRACVEAFDNYPVFTSFKEYE